MPRGLVVKWLRVLPKWQVPRRQTRGAHAPSQGVIAGFNQSELVFEVEPTPIAVSGHTEPKDLIGAPDFARGPLIRAHGRT